MRHRIAGRGAKGWMVGAALMVAAAAPSSAQGTGNGYLFGEPSGRATLRAGWAFASAGSDFFDQATTDFTLSKSDFSGPTFGGELAYRIAPRLDFTVDGAYAGVDRNSHYRKFTDSNGQEIEQSTSLKRVPLTANIRAYLASPGRSVGSLAFIPARVVPWLGVGAGATWYDLKQTGDFIDTNTLNVFPATFHSSGWGPALQGMGGIDLTLTPRIAATADARYTWSRATLGGDFQGYDKIDLSGVAVTLGLTFRL
jgi:hypothetical protein